MFSAEIFRSAHMEERGLRRLQGTHLASANGTLLPAPPATLGA